MLFVLPAAFKIDFQKQKLFRTSDGSEPSRIYTAICAERAGHLRLALGSHMFSYHSMKPH